MTNTMTQAERRIFLIKYLLAEYFDVKGLISLSDYKIDTAYRYLSFSDYVCDFVNRAVEAVAESGDEIINKYFSPAIFGIVCGVL